MARTITALRIAARSALNTRLAVIDTSDAGHQPMNDPETGNWITYNGETYNFKQLRSEIDSDAHAWRSSSDTEVVLRAYEMGR